MLVNVANLCDQHEPSAESACGNLLSLREISSYVDTYLNGWILPAKICQTMINVTVPLNSQLKKNVCFVWHLIWLFICETAGILHCTDLNPGLMFLFLQCQCH